jgi:hypothetical protein
METVLAIISYQSNNFKRLNNVFSGNGANCVVVSNNSDMHGNGANCLLVSNNSDMLENRANCLLVLVLN